MPRTVQDLLHDAVGRHQRGDLAGAEQLYRDILSRDANCADALHLLGVVAHQSGRSDLATALIQRAIVLNPSAAIYHNNLGEAWRLLGQPDRARGCYERAIQINPKYADPRVNLGTILQQRGDSAAAAREYRAAIDVSPANADAHLNLGNVLHGQGQLDEAEACQRRAIELNPRSAKAQNNLGIVLMELGRPEEARGSFRRALELDRTYCEAQSNLLLCLHYDRGDQAEELFEEHRRGMRASIGNGVTECGSDGVGRWALRHSVTPSPRHSAALRIAYISPDFRDHPVAAFFEPILLAQDRSQFEVFAYSDVVRPDATTQRIAGRCHGWRDIAGKSDQQLAAMLAEDRIDILIDLAGHTARNRLAAFARRLAPVQITYLGYPNTTGLDAMDFRITDAHCDPPGVTERFHTEQLLRVEPSFLCYKPPEMEPCMGEPPAIRQGHITFGSFNNFAKITSAMLRTWAAILSKVPGSRLILKAKALSSASTRDRVLATFRESRIEIDRIELLAQVASHVDHLNAYNKVDIALDTFPYCGTTTTCEALWMGVPVISRAGMTHVSRVGCSILSSVGLKSLVCEGDEPYVHTAVKLAGDSDALTSLRRHLRNRVSDSPLCDARRLARRIEAAFRHAWQSKGGA